MTETVRTPLAEWRQRADGSWEPVPSVSGRAASSILAGNADPNGPYLTPGEVDGGDNVLVTQLPDGTILIERGGHAILYQGVEKPWRTSLDFTGGGVDVTDDGINDRTVVTIPGISLSGAMKWRGEYNPSGLYTPGDVVWFEDALFVFTDSGVAYGYGYGPYGGGPYGATPLAGFGTAPYGYGPYGGS